MAQKHAERQLVVIYRRYGVVAQRMVASGWAVVQGMLRTSDLRGVRFLVAIASIFMAGSQVLWRPRGLGEIVPPEVWSGTFCVTGLTLLWINIKNTPHEKWAVLVAGFTALLWTYVTVSICISRGPYIAAIPVEAAIVIGSAWLFIRSEHKVTHKRRRTDYGSGGSGGGF